MSAMVGMAGVALQVVAIVATYEVPAVRMAGVDSVQSVDSEEALVVALL